MAEVSFDQFPEVGEPTTETAPTAGDAPTEIPTGDDFGAFPEVTPSRSIEEEVRTLGRSATGAALEATPIVSGALTGARLAASGGPVRAAAGAVLGGLAGTEVGRPLREFVSDIQVPFLGRIANPPFAELPPEERGFGAAGEVLGGGVPFALAPVGIAGRLPKSFVGNFVNRIFDAAGRAPKTFLGAEAASLVGAATGAVAAQKEFPDRPGIRLGAELLGGFFNPQRIIIGNIGAALSSAKRAIRALTPAGRETAAAKKIIGILEEAGDDPKVIADMLDKAPGIPGLTAAQKTGNEALSEFEAKIANSSAKFGADVKKSAEEGLAAVSQMIIALRGTGDPVAIQTAAEMTQKRFKTVLASRLKLAESEAADAAAKITTDTPAARAEVGRIANKALGTALEDSRKVESSLWDAIPLEVAAKSDNTVQRVVDIKGELLPEEKLPAVVEGFIKRMQKSGGDTTAGELIKLRKRALALGRQADAKGDFNDARIFGQLAEATLEDMDAVFSGPNVAALRLEGIDTEAYNAARTFSRELHETFTRTFAGQTLQTGPRGADRIPPELLLRRATSGGAEATELKLRELEEATNFLPTRNLGGPEAIENHNVMIDAQERLLRLAATDAADPVTGVVNADKLQKFINTHEELMDRFPQVAEDLQAAAKSETALKDIENAIKGSTRIFESQTAFSRIADVGNPVVAINRIVAGKNPVIELTQLAKLAKKSGEEATTGLQASIWDHALEKATSSTGDISMGRFKSALFDPVRPGEPSLMNLMKTNKIITADQVKKTEELFGEINKIATAMRATGGLDELVDSPAALVDLVLSIAGSRASTVFTQGKGMAGASLIAAGRGASAARNMFSKVPAAKTFNVMQEAAKNPEFMAMLLRKTATQEEAIKLNQQVHAYLWQAGLLSDEEEVQ